MLFYIWVLLWALLSLLSSLSRKFKMLYKINKKLYCFLYNFMVPDLCNCSRSECGRGWRVGEIPNNPYTRLTRASLWVPIQLHKFIWSGRVREGEIPNSPYTHVWMQAVICWCSSLMMAIFLAESGSVCFKSSSLSSQRFILPCHWLLVDDGHLPQEVRILLFPSKQHAIIYLHTVMALA